MSPQKSSSALSIDQIRAMYNALLGEGQAAEPRLAKRVGAPPEKLFRLITAGDDFNRRALQPLMNGLPLPHGKRSVGPAEDELRRLTEPLGLDIPQGWLGRQVHWWEVMHLLLTSPRARAMSPRIDALHPDDVKLWFDPYFASKGSKTSLAVEIRQLGTWELGGWAVDREDLGRSITLDFYADDLYLGSALCNRYRRELEERIGGSGCYGFAFRLPGHAAALTGVGMKVTAYESLSGLPVASPVLVQRRLAASLNELAVIHRRLDQMAEALAQLQQELPRLRSRAVYPLEAYDQMMRDVGALDLPASGDAGLPMALTVLCEIRTPEVGDVARLVHGTRRLRDRGATFVLLWRSPSLFEEGEVGPTAGLTVDPALEEEEPRDQVLRVVGALDPRRFVLQVAPDDQLDERAAALVTPDRSDADVLYFDHDHMRTGDDGYPVFQDPWLKPAPDETYLLSYDYIRGAAAVRAGIVVETLRSEAMLSEEYGWPLVCYAAALRLLGTGRGAGVEHVPRLLLHRPVPAEEQATHHAEACLRVGGAVLSAAAAPLALARHADPFGLNHPLCGTLVLNGTERLPAISIIIQTRDRNDLIGPCLSSLQPALKAYAGRTEVIVVNNDSTDAKTIVFLESLARGGGIKLVSAPGPFNWSGSNNRAAQMAEGGILLFLNNDIVAARPDFLMQTAKHFLRERVGVVGARLLYEDGTIQHAGVLMGVGGIAAHDGRYMPTHQDGYLLRNRVAHEASAVTGACLATPRTLFFDLGMFDERNFRVAFNDVDYCLRCRERGMRVVIDPAITLYHFESRTRGMGSSKTDPSQRRERETLTSRWRGEIARDPFYHPAFDRHAEPFSALRLW